MGFCIWLLEANVRIPVSVHDQVLDAIKSLHPYHTEGSGEAATTSVVSYHWVDSQEVLESENLGSALDAWRWSPSFDQVGNIVNLRFNGQKAGYDEVLFDVLAPFVEDGCFLVIEDEDGAVRRWCFEGDGCRVELLKAKDLIDPDTSWRSQVPS